MLHKLEKFTSPKCTSEQLHKSSVKLISWDVNILNTDSVSSVSFEVWRKLSSHIHSVAAVLLGEMMRMLKQNCRSQCIHSTLTVHFKRPIEQPWTVDVRSKNLSSHKIPGANTVCQLCVCIAGFNWNKSMHTFSIDPEQIPVLNKTFPGQPVYLLFSAFKH